MKKLITITNILLILCLGLVLMVLATGGGRFEIYGLKISVTTVKGPLRCFVLLLLLKHIISGNGAFLSGLLEKRLSYISNFFEFEKIYKGEFWEKKKLLSDSIFFSAIAGIALLVADSIKYSKNLCYGFVVSSVLPQGFSARLFFIAGVLIFYGLIWLIVGYFLQKTLSLIFSSQHSPLPSRKISVLQFDVILLFVIFLITSRFSILNLIYTFLPLHNQNVISDIVLQVLILFLIAVIFPCLILAKKYLKATCVILASFIVSLSYTSYGAYREGKMPESSDSAKNPSVILITIDTTRADHFGMYGYKRDTTPNLSLIAKEGITFTRAYVAMNLTDPSHASILTGVYPRTHGLLNNAMSISNKKIFHLAEWFKKRNYITAAITSRALLNPETMKLKGFDYINIPNDLYRSVTADITYNRAKKWIDSYGKAPFFIWIHFWDPHREYDPPKSYNSKFNNGYRGPLKERKSPQGYSRDTHFTDPKYEYNTQEIEYLTSLYDGEIAFTDEYISKFIRYSEEKISGSRTYPLFIITADHGETLGEVQARTNFSFNHGTLLRYGQIHVPLIFKWKGIIPQNKVIKDIVENVDIAPTIIELLGNGGEFKCDGRSFAGLMLNGEGTGKEAAYSQRRLFENATPKFLNYPEYSVTTEKWFLIFNERKGTELYDISNDPLEQTDIAKERKDVVDMLLSKLDNWKNSFPMTLYKTEKLSDDKIKVLRSLGYMQ